MCNSRFAIPSVELRSPTLCDARNCGQKGDQTMRWGSGTERLQRSVEGSPDGEGDTAARGRVQPDRCLINDQLRGEESQGRKAGGCSSLDFSVLFCVLIFSSGGRSFRAQNDLFAATNISGFCNSFEGHMVTWLLAETLLWFCPMPGLHFPLYTNNLLLQTLP